MSAMPFGGTTWYETGLSPKERKRRGHFSTPPELVKHILDACGYSPEADLVGMRVLDPACGSGNFLLEVAHRLLACSAQRDMDQAAKAALMQRNLWGFDPDPVACFLADIQLRAVLNWLEEPPIGLHIHQADALVLPWEACVDLVVGNPPYLAAKNNDLSGYQTTQQRGQADSYLLFLSLAMQALRLGGWMGLVLPDPVLARANATKERERLLKEATIHHIWHLSNVFAADVGAVVIIAQKCSPRSLHQVSWVRGKWQNALPVLRSLRACEASPKALDRAKRLRGHAGGMAAMALVEGTCQIPQSLFLRQPGAEMRYLLNSARGSIIERLRQQMDEPGAIPRGLAPLGEFLTISRGEELGKNSHFITKKCNGDPCGRQAHDCCNEKNESLYPVLLGGIDIRPYTVPTATHWIVREAVVKPLQRYQSPKLLVVKSTDRLQAALDKQGHVALQTLYLLHPCTRDTSEDDLYFFLALLNSRLLREYVYMLHTAYKWVQPQIEQSVLARLPIPMVESTGVIHHAPMRQRIARIARLLEDACSGGRAVVEWKQDMYDEQERAICALYETVLPGLCTDVINHVPTR